MTTEPPTGAGWPPQQPQGGPAPEPRPFPAVYPPPAPGAPYPAPAPGAPYPAPAGAGMPGSPLPMPPEAPAGPGMLPEAPTSRGPDALPEPPTGMQPALQWGDPTPAPAPPPKPGPPPPFSKLAITTLGLGVLAGGGGLALVTGAVALLRLRSTRKRGQGLAVVGMVLTVAWAALGALIYVNVLSQPPLRGPDGAVTRKGDLAVTQLKIGDCIEKFSASTEIGKVTVVPCTTAHNAEVFHTFTLTGDDYPGDGPVREESSKQCLDALKTTISEADRKTVQVAVFKPLAISWKRGEHGVACVAVQTSGTVTRSIRAA